MPAGGVRKGGITLDAVDGVDTDGEVGIVVAEFSASLAQLAEPGLGGLLIQVLSAPVALAVDALSFLLSALFLVRILHSEQPQSRLAWADPAGDRRRAARDLR